jgi:hypothetical protein
MALGMLRACYVSWVHQDWCGTQAAMQHQPIRNPAIKGIDKISRNLHYWSTQLTISRPYLLHGAESF